MHLDDLEINLKSFIEELKHRNSLPKSIQFALVGAVAMANVYDVATSIITDEVTTGMDIDPNTALFKGLVERIEREAFVRGKIAGFSSCQTDTSDGFAAYPRCLGNADEISRKHALFEAVERFVWSTWWDEKEISHDYWEVRAEDSSLLVKLLFLEFEKILPIKKIYKICPSISNSPDIEVSIFFAFIEPFGVLSGGAAGLVADKASVDFRAVCELVRHGLALKSFLSCKAQPKSFYEKRLMYFGNTEEGTQLALERVSQKGIRSLKLPELEFDQNINHNLDEIVSVHRCLFRNQPPFIGGKMERLCL